MMGRNRLVWFVGAGCVLWSLALSQQADTVLYFPDSMGYCHRPTAILHNPVTGRVYVANGGDVGGVLVFDPGTRTKTRFLRGYYYCGIYCPDVNKVYLGGAGIVAVLDGAEDSLLRTVDIDISASGLVYSPVSFRLYAADGENSEWVALDPLPDTLLGELEEFSAAASPVWDSVANRIYAAYREAGRIESYDCYGDSLVGWLKVIDEGRVTGLVLNPASRRLYCATEADTVYVVDVDSLRLVNAIDAVNGPLMHNPVLNRLYGTFGDSVVVVDCANDSVRARVAAAGCVLDFVLNTGDGRAYGGLYTSDEVVVLDAGDTVAARIGLDSVGTPGVLDYAPERNELYCAMLSDNVAIVDCRADTLSGVMDYPHYVVRGLVHGSVGNKLYLLSTERDTVLVLDRDYRLAGVIAVPMIKWNIFPVYNPGLNRLYLADSNRLWVIDCNGDTLLGARGLDGLRRASTALLVQQLGKLYVFPRYSPYDVQVYDCLRDTVVAAIPLSSRVVSAAYHPWSNQVYASVSGSSTMAAIDPVGDTVVKTFWAGRHASSNELLANTINGRLYHASNSSTERLYTIDVRANAVVDSVDLPNDGDTIFWYQRTNKLYLCDRSTSGQVSVFDCNSGAIVRTLALPCGYAGALDEASERLYLGGRKSVYVLDCRYDSVVATLPIPDEPRFSAVNPIDNRVYFAERSNWVAVYQDVLGLEEERVGEAAPAFRVLGNPARGGVRFRCRIPAGWKAEFLVYDIAGRLASRSWITGRNGTLVFAWDGRDNAGRRVAAGVYFGRLECRGRTETVKVVLE